MDNKPKFKIVRMYTDAQLSFLNISKATAQSIVDNIDLGFKVNIDDEKRYVTVASSKPQKKSTFSKEKSSAQKDENFVVPLAACVSARREQSYFLISLKMYTEVMGSSNASMDELKKVLKLNVQQIFEPLLAKLTASYSVCAQDTTGLPSLISSNTRLVDEHVFDSL